MTADAREKLAAALAEHVLFGTSCRCGWQADLEAEEDWKVQRERHPADALLPVVDEIAGKRAAEELRAAADEVRGDHGTASLSAKRIDARAAALDANPAPEPVAHNHTRVRNAVAGPWSPCPVSCPAAGLLR